MAWLPTPPQRIRPALLGALWVPRVLRAAPCC